MSFGSAERVAIPTTGAPTINSPSPEGAVGAMAVIGAEVVGADGAEGMTEGDRRANECELVDDSTAPTIAGGGVNIVTSTGAGVGVPGQSSRARGAVDTRPIAAPHVRQNRCPGGLLALHAGQMAGPSALNDLENLNDGASGR